MRAPLIMLPLRLETMLDEDNTGPMLRLRAYPDQIHVDSLRRDISPQERALLDTVAGMDDPQAATTQLISALGPHRAAYLRHMEGRIPETSDDTTRPIARCLPHHLVGRVTLTDGQQFIAEGNPIPDALPLAPTSDDTEAFSGSSADPLLWMVDFDTAEKLGMALRISAPTSRDFSDLDRIEVIGVPRAGDGGADQDELNALFEAHWGGPGLTPLPAGTATKGFDGPVPHEGAKHQSVSRLLGLPRHVMQGADSALAGDAAHSPVATLVWHAAMHPALLHGYGIGDEAPLTDHNAFDPIMRLFVESLQPNGAYPTLVVGDQPYGIHPMLDPGDPDVPATAAAISTVIPDLAAHARDRAFEQRRGSEWETLLDTLARDARSSVLRKRRVHPVMSWANLALNNVGGQGASDLPQAADLRLSKLDALQIRQADEEMAAVFSASDHEAPLLKLPYVGRDVTDASAPRPFDPIVDLLSLTPDELVRNFAHTNFESVLHFLSMTALREGVLHLAAAHVADSDYTRMLAQLSAFSSFAENDGDWENLLAQAFGRRERQPTVAELIETFEPRTALAKRMLSDLGDIARAVRRLPDLPAGQVHRALAGALDAAAFRFDAWVSSTANEKLAALRDRSDTGVHIGAYGFLEGTGQLFALERPLFRVAPSVAHATTAGMLHEAQEAFAERGQGPLAAVDLSARRVRAGETLAHHIRAGADMPEALGNIVLTALANVNASHLARSVAKTFPLMTETAANDPSARPVIDGQEMLHHVQAGTLATVQFELDGGPGALDPMARIAIEGALTDTLEGYKDLCLAEGIHNFAEGTVDAARSSFEAMAGGAPPPDKFQVVDAPQPSATLSFKVAITASDHVGNGWLDQASPVLANTAAHLVGPIVGQILCTLEDGAEVAIALDTLPLSPLDLALLCAPGGRAVDRITPILATALAATGVTAPIVQIAPDLAADDTLWSAGRTAALILSARALTEADLPRQNVPDTEIESANMQAQHDARHRLVSTLSKPVLPVETALRLVLMGLHTDAAALATALRTDPAGSDTALADARAALSSISTENILDKVATDLPIPRPLSAVDSAEVLQLDPSKTVDLAAWLEDVQEIVDTLHPLADLLFAGAETRLSATVWQGQDDARAQDIPEHWIAGTVSPKAVQGVVQSTLLLHTSDVALGGGGLLLADWTEALGRDTADIGIAARGFAPPGRAPNAIIAVASATEDKWDRDRLFAVVDTLRDQITARNVDLTTLPGQRPYDLTEPLGHNLGLLLPLLWLNTPPVPNPEV